jgi:hypothetical protein
MRFLLPALLTLAAACTGDPELRGPFVDGFDRDAIGSDYFNSGGPYRIERGQLMLSRAHNHPLWLRRRLPRDLKLELDCTPHSPEGDVKIELFGDGKAAESADSVEKDLIYTTTSYVLIFGGWRNSRSVLVRQDEHAWEHPGGAPLRTSPRPEPGRTYHFTVTRRGGTLDWQIDGQPFLHLEDSTPLAGPGHDHFGFTGWETEVAFDNLRIEPL